jgi:hypothetical protein
VKRIVQIILQTTICFVIYAEVPPNYRFVKTWRIDNRFGVVDSIPVDSLPHNFQYDNPIDKFSIANSYTGNLGSPIQAKIYFDRPLNTDFIFSNAYFPYVKNYTNTVYYNTKTPYSMLHYISGGSPFRDQDLLKFFFTANANKRLNFGLNIDYSLSPGEYANQRTKRNSVTLFGSYNGKHYSAYGTFYTNELYNKESGGLYNIGLIDSTDNQFFKTLETKIDAESKFSNSGLFYNHQYTLGFEKSHQIKKDSVYVEYIPVTRFTHTLKFDNVSRHYYENAVEKEFYTNTYFKSLVHTRDTAALQTISNTVAISLAEEFNRLLRFGLTAFAENEQLNYTHVPYQDSIFKHSAYNSTKLGGILAKNQSKLFRYNTQAEIMLLGFKAGDFKLEANMEGNFKLWKDSLNLKAKAFSRSDEPSILLQEYASNHFKWKNDFNKTNRTHISGTFSIPTRLFSFSLMIENISNYIYFNNNSLPKQEKNNIQVIAANLNQSFKIGKMALENCIVFQKSSDDKLLPLPAITLLENLFYEDKWFKVLTMQIGINLRYHTSYYAPSYMPAIGQFYNQNTQLIGNYPITSAYINFHIKRVRAFVQYYHINQLFFKNQDFLSMPDYPLAPAIIKTGISWSFYD